MVTKISRLDVLNNNNIAVVISEIQKVMYDDDPENYLTESDRVDQLKSFDATGLITKPVEQFYSIISFEHSDIKTFTNELTAKILALLNLFNTTDIFIISHLKFNLFGKLKNKYPPLKNALEKTKKLLGSLNYDEAFQISLEDLHSFVETFFWIERCDPSAPEYIYFADLDDRFAFHFCKHGNIHLIEFENEIINTEILSSSNMYFVNDCWEQFSSKPGIEGRALSL